VSPRCTSPSHQHKRTNKPGHVSAFQERSCLCSLPLALWGKTWLVAYFHNEDHRLLVVLKVVVGLFCWTGVEYTELEPFILGTAQTWGERMDFVLMHKMGDKRSMRRWVEAVRLCQPSRVTKLLARADGCWGSCLSLPSPLLTHPVEMAQPRWGNMSQTGTYLP